MSKQKHQSRGEQRAQGITHHSKRRVKKFGIAGTSDKQDKRFANRKLRRQLHQRAQSADPLELKFNAEILDLVIRDVSDPWGFNKDGKHFWRDALDKDMNK